MRTQKQALKKYTLALRCFSNIVIVLWSLDILIISNCVRFQVGMFIPFIARTSSSINALNFKLQALVLASSHGRNRDSRLDSRTCIKLHVSQSGTSVLLDDEREHGARFSKGPYCSVVDAKLHQRSVWQMAITLADTSDHS